MADYDVFAGSYVSVFYNSDITNEDIDSVKFQEVPEAAAFPTSGIEREVINVPNFTHKFGRKLVGRASVPSIDISVNYIPGSIHDSLKQLAESGKRGQFKLVYWFDADKSAGVGIVYNGFLSKANITGGETDSVKLEMTLEVDKGPVVEKLVVATPSA
ncbi:hypothetical protein [Pantoea sp. MBLJ3]|uniref:hypothetical protein n=1 Tax=Pantoea sp. MBLJ3 TaxID=1562889 RepID=UPI0005805C95|nr:hypothetical protein [Pantoea sp. MBLJ3]